MHPKELSHMALAAASAARLDGFQATADAFFALAAACEAESRWANQPDHSRPSDQLIRHSFSDQDLVFLLH